MTTNDYPNLRGLTVNRISITPLLTIVLLAISTTVASAHVGVGDTSGFSHGFWHPIGGPDHVLAMILVGLYAAQLGGRAIWLVPASFVSLMIIGGSLGFAGVPVPFIELGIGLSVIVLGAAVAFGFRIAPTAAMTLVGFFAIFHGHAHATEMPETAAGLSYGAGFIAATVLLHCLGLIFGVIFASGIGPRGETLMRVAGGVAAAAGVGILTGII